MNPSFTVALQLPPSAPPPPLARAVSTAVLDGWMVVGKWGQCVLLRQKLKVCHIPEADACNSYLWGFT